MKKGKKRIFSMFLVLLLLVGVFELQNAQKVSANELQEDTENLENQGSTVPDAEDGLEEENTEVEEEAVNEDMGDTQEQTYQTVNADKEIAPRSNMDTVTVSTEADLIAELADVANISGATKVINIDTSLILTNVISVNMAHGKDVIIKSLNKATLTAAANKKHFQVSNGTGKLTIENIILKGLITDSFMDGDRIDFDTVGGSTAGGGISGNISSGEIHLEGLIYTRIKNGGFDITAGKATINNCVFISNFTDGGGAAIRYDSVNTPTYITNTSFIDNATDTNGYTGGAIHLKSGTADFSIKGSYFADNTMRGGGNIMAGGGAIAIAQSNRTFTVENSLFENNVVLKPSSGSQWSLGANSDGGAIYIFTSKGKHTIENSTFKDNIAYDEGGAIAFVVTPNVENAVRNSTFVGNIAQNLQVFDGEDGGGAIEIDSGSSSNARCYVEIEHNTFYRNDAQKGSNKGGGIAYKYADGILHNNIIVGNIAAKADINIYKATNATITDRDGNADLTISNVIGDDVKETFGNVSPQLAANGSSFTAGGLTEKKIIPTIMIKPEGLADDKSDDTLTQDQNSNPRDLVAADLGALEIKWVKYDTNIAGSNWTLAELLDGPKNHLYYEGENPSVVYYGLYPYQSTSITTYQAPNAPSSDYIFLGWNTKADGTGMTYTPEQAHSIIMDSNITLYGKWQRVLLRVDFESNGGTAVSSITDITNGSLISEPVEPTREGFTFKGWYLDDGTFVDGWNFATDIVTSNITLYAKWETIPKHTVTYDGNGNTDGIAPIDPLSPYYIDSEITVLGKNTLVKENHTFTGWNTKADGTGISYEEADVFTITEDVTLYAQWKENSKYTVLYDGNGNTEGIAPIDVLNPYYVDSEVTVLGKNTLVKENHTFTGWNTKADGTGISYEEADVFTITEDVTLYAQWKKVNTKPIDPVKPPKPSEPNTPTGDNTNILEYSIIGVGSLLGIMLITKKKKQVS